MNDMWDSLEKYQHYAERHGFGDAWRRMTTERTPDAAALADATWVTWAADAAWAAANAAAEAARAAAWEAAEVADAADAAAAAAEARVIKYINEAIKLEGNE
jgi:hypothetical protein